jgi:predicted permease
VRRRFFQFRDEARLDSELRFHLERQIADYIAQGVSPAEAARRARLEFGGLSQVKEAVRDVRPGAFIDTVLQDVRHAFRSLVASPGFTIAAVFSLALGIGANTAIFSIVDALLLKPLPVSEPAELTFLAFPRGGTQFDPRFSGPEFRAIRERSRAVFTDVTAMVLGGLWGPSNRSDGLTVDSVTRPVQTMFVSGDFFQMLGIQPYLGRFILPSEGGAPGADPVIVLGYRYWQSRFHGDPAVVNKAAVVNGHPVTIVGIAPKGFLGPTPIVDMEAYLPLGMMTVETAEKTAFLDDPRTRDLLVVGRLAPRTSLAQANAALAPLGYGLAKDSQREGVIGPLEARPLRPPGLLNGQNPFPALAALFLTLAGLVFVLACLNVTNLTLVRAAVRRREIAVRAALGGSRWRLVRHLVTETVIVALFGSVVGMVAGSVALRALSLRLTAVALPLTLEFPFNIRAFAFAIAVALAGAAFIGIVPALRASGGNLTDALRDGGRSGTGHSQRTRRALVAAQIAGTLALLVVAGLFVRSLRGVQHSDLGFDPQPVLNVRLDPGEIGYTDARGAAFYRELLARVRALPGVRFASLTATVPLADDARTTTIAIPGYVARRGESMQADVNAVSPGFFDTLKISIVSGRAFTDMDADGRTRVAIINQAMAARFWAGESPIGRTFSARGDVAHLLQVVGVARNSRIEDPYSPYTSAFYVPLAQEYSPAQTLQIRTTSAPEALAREVVAAVHAVAPTAPVLNVRTMTDAVANGDSGFFIFNVGAMLTASLGLLGLSLALVGMYGVMAYAIGQRTHEIGIRIALGAQRSRILWLVSREGLITIAIGLAIGIAAALAVGSLVRDFLVGVGPADPVTYITVSLVLIATALCACYVPVRRAVRLDPVDALRHE